MERRRVDLEPPSPASLRRCSMSAPALTPEQLSSLNACEVYDENGTKCQVGDVLEEAAGAWTCEWDKRDEGPGGAEGGSRVSTND